jgi:rubrerythrin
MALTKDEVVKAAAQLERDGYDFYVDVAKKATNPQAKAMFESLADDEIDHLHWIEGVEPGVNTAEAANRSLYSKLAPLFANVPAEERASLRDAPSDVEAIHAAIKIEEKAAAAYEDWAGECDDPAVRELCETLVGVEEFHKQVLMNTLEYFEHTPDWFMQEEQWNFEGGVA